MHIEIVMPPQTTSKLESIYSELLNNLLSGKWQVGENIPIESELARKFDCSLGTVSKAVALLVHEGYVERRTRSGTRVLKNTIAPENNASIIKLDAYAFIYPSDQHEGLRRTVHGFQDRAKEMHRRLLSLTTGDNYQEEIEIIGRLSEFDVRGAAIHPVILTAQDRMRFTQLLVSSKLPIVLVGVNLPGINCSAVITDDFDGAYTMTKHLLDQGLTRVGFIADHSVDMSMRDRYQGYRRALCDAGIKENPEWVLREPSMLPNFEDPLAKPTEMGLHYLKRAKGVEGVVCVHDFLGVGLIRAARQMGLRVPEDLKVTGMDDYEISHTGDISLTTYRVPSEVMGREAFDLLDTLVNGTPDDATERLVKGELVVRNSSKA